ncbi:dTDP-4-dehydrorhamnose reductase [Oceanihabitans sp. 2_MG-2023]|uniref:dTDP-4-dehydrorhamnose reductase n=1 Tax=Oceanihabitans sp. 2_MG-2023 TaxID=3062661 RepID=UPI0026E116BD|nr:dTDP-4-dehydrorhamnose reductase [Oceanihabitans sp. 2_MG-2023]MDO6595866.1 dTDP-4-dehydrorhamnose reductase [Oceanihabitans sp. 2_MG-2023]
MKTKVLVTGANGQLGKTLASLKTKFKNLDFIFASTLDLDITKSNQVETFFYTNKIDWCINCAAYTAVDKAEKEPEKAKKVNVLGVKNLALVCANKNVALIQISTDFVFNGEKSVAYTEKDTTKPTGVYGTTKLEGEIEIIKKLEKYFIIRTSWLYSQNGNNFMKTMIKLSKERKKINVVSDQIGTPTYTTDLAEIMLKIITTNNKQYGTYHYSNEGVASWYDFAKAIFEESNIDINVLPIKSEAYPTPAKRPHFSVLDKTKIKTNLKIEIPHWRVSLRKAIANNNE